MFYVRFISFTVLMTVDQLKPSKCSSK